MTISVLLFYFLLRDELNFEFLIPNSLRVSDNDFGKNPIAHVNIRLYSDERAAN